jgi:8-oxo-dGTP pyrophosphatase MutT (NUDIX family)
MEVRAAGGVLVEEGRVLLVHRSRYDDWSLPKGKAKDGESYLACALREVEEETGFRCEPLRELGETHYEVPEGPKTVRYWLMRRFEGEFEPNGEVDEIRWLEPAEAAALLTQERDRELLDLLSE